MIDQPSIRSTEESSLSRTPVTSGIVELSQPRDVAMESEWFELNHPGHFWMRWRLAVLRKYFSDVVATAERLIEIGSGNNVFRVQVEHAFDKMVDGCDLDAEAVSQGQPGRGQRFIYDVFEHSEEMEGKYDLAFLMDVLEHIDDDVEFLRSTARCLVPGGKLILNVPALNLLYGRYDEAQGHVRRYSIASLTKAAESAGLQVERSRYWGTTLVPVALLRKLVLCPIADPKRVMRYGFAERGGLMNACFAGMMKLELNLMPRFPLGTSVMMLIRKK